MLFKVASQMKQLNMISGLDILLSYFIKLEIA